MCTLHRLSSGRAAVRSTAGSSVGDADERGSSGLAVTFRVVNGT